MTTDELTTTDRIDPTKVRPVVRVGLAIVGLVVLLLLGRVLPGSDLEVLDAGVTVGDLVLAIGTVGIAAALVYGAPKLRDLLTDWLEGPAGVVANAAAIGSYLVYFLAVLVAYRGLASTIQPLLRPGWLYGVFFLGLALVVLGGIAYRYFRAMDPITGFLARRVADGDRTGHVEGDEQV